MQVIERTIHYNRPDVFYLYPFSDAHLGSSESAERALELKVAECASRGQYGLAIGCGDYADCITHNDPRFRNNGLALWVEKTNIVESQRRHVKEVFKPLVEQGQLICLGTGNHEEEIHHRHDNDITRNICTDINVPYAGYQAYIVLKFVRAGKTTHSIVIHSWHGAGAAQTEGARLNRLMRLVNDIQADIYLMGHLHTMTAHTPDRLVVTHGIIKSVKLAATITGSWLKTYNQPAENEIQDPTYGEEKGYKPSRIGCPVIRITPENYSDPHADEFVIES